MFGLFRKQRKKKAKKKPAPTPHMRPEIRDVYLTICKAKNMLDMIPDADLVYAKRAMNTLEDILWQSVNR